MIKFRCRKTPWEHLDAWLEKDHKLENSFSEKVVTLVRHIRDIDTFFSSENLPNKEYFNKAKEYLVEKGEKNAQVFFLRDPETKEIERGSTRIPLKVKTKESTYIIKPYDSNDSELEKEVLKTVSGKIGPKVLHLGEKFYSEELIKSSEYTSLHTHALETGAFTPEKRLEIWDHMFGKKHAEIEARNKLVKNMAEAVKPICMQGAEIHAELAKLGVIYDHNHWLDEFLVAENRNSVVIDFGTSHFFSNPEEIKEKLPGLKAEERKLAQYYDEEAANRSDALSDRINRMEGYMFRHEHIKTKGSDMMFKHKDLNNHAKQALKDNHENINLLTNLYKVMFSAYEGMKNFFYFAGVGSGKDYMIHIETAFESRFLNHYFS